MPEWASVLGAISVVAVAAGIVSGPSMLADRLAVAQIPNQPPSSFPTPAPRGMPVVPAPPPAPELLPPVQAPSPVPVGPPVLPTAPARHPVTTAPPNVFTPPPPTETHDSVPPPSPTCPIGLVVDPILGVCVSI